MPTLGTGPMAAAIAYLMEWQWQVHEFSRWHRPAGRYLVENEISIRDPWWKLERALLHEAKAQRAARLASITNTWSPDQTGAPTNR